VVDGLDASPSLGGILGGKRIVGGPGNTQKVRLGRSPFIQPDIWTTVPQIKLTPGEKLALIAGLIVVASLIPLILLLTVIEG